jgi:hypothetical protein
MNSEAAAECVQCAELLDTASRAMGQHLRAVSRLEIARLRRESELIPALEAVVRQASQERESSIAAYKAHRALHVPGISGKSA